MQFGGGMRLSGTHPTKAAPEVSSLIALRGARSVIQTATCEALRVSKEHEHTDGMLAGETVTCVNTSVQVSPKAELTLR